MPDQRPETEMPISIWPTAQTSSRTQRKGRYVPGSMAHPGKMLPAIAAHAIKAYSKPGDLIIDPMCGIGTTLVEAAHADRLAIGVEYEKRWSDLAVDNVTHATANGAPGYGVVVHGDARDIERLVGSDVRGKAALVLTSPPYGASTHGRVHTIRETGVPVVAKSDHRYSRDPGNLAHRGLEELFEGFTEILTGCRALLKPGGFLVITTRPIRAKGTMIDIPGLALRAALAAGFENYERCAALLAGIQDNGLRPRPSFFANINTRTAHAAGDPLHLVIHEDVLVLRSAPPLGAADAEEPTDADDDPGCGCVPLFDAEPIRRAA